MKIGVITYYKVMNFGATLQAVSTFCYLQNNGHTPIFINYQSPEAQENIKKRKNVPQWDAQLDFVNSVITNQTEVCTCSDEVLLQVKKHGIDAIIIGSDALLQHHSFIARLRKGTRKPIYIQSIASDRLFPNVFWGVDINNQLPVALMSVSSQNSEYKLFAPYTVRKMKDVLSKMKYISVRDTWTQSMVMSIANMDVPVTPDPVFAFNQNASHLVPPKQAILEKFGLSESYILLSLFGQAIPKSTISELKDYFNSDGKQLVILPMPTGGDYEYDADVVIKFPLSPIDWYALIKYSSAYIGSNMHPIVVSLHNAVPCFSLDIWGRTNFFNKKVKDNSSKVKHIMGVFGVESNHRMIDNGYCNVSAKEIYKAINAFPIDNVKRQAAKYLDEYNVMMNNIIKAIQ